MINPITYLKNFYYDIKALWQLQQDTYLTHSTVIDYDYAVDAIDSTDMANTPFEEITLTGREDAMDYAQQLKREGSRSAYAITKIINDNGYKVSQSTVTRWVRKDLL